MDQHLVFKLSGSKHGIKRGNPGPAGNEDRRCRIIKEFSPGFCNPDGVAFTEVTQTGSKIPFFNNIVQYSYLIFIFTTANTIQAAWSILFYADPDDLASPETEIAPESNQENAICNLF